MKTFIKGQPVRLTRQENSEFWSFGEDVIEGFYVNRNHDPEDEPYVHMVDVVGYDQIHIVSDDEIEAI